MTAAVRGPVEVSPSAAERASPIVTPDRRLRVFVSSTLQELAEERAQVSRAIRGLRLSPVLFELGARPHPPRSLYRAYLDQSDVFVGVYWQSYGWVAAGAGVSGVEDEYNLAQGKPKLIYVKEPAPEREPRLAAVLDRVQQDGDASYKRFRTAAQLGALVAEDLAVLLTERFQATSTHPQDAVDPRDSWQSAGNLPLPPAPLIGRNDLMALVSTLLEGESVQLVTLTGTGGVGKTRLALQVARAAGHRFAGGAWLVSLAGIRDTEGIAAAILDAFPGSDVGNRPAPAAVVDHLRARQCLLLLDNFEHALSAASFVAALVAACPHVKLLVTSRAPLRVRAEHEVPLSVLGLPAERATAQEAMRSAAVQMFVDRARAARPGFGLDEANAGAVAAICRRLDGLPLALELAAARTRVLRPDDLLKRLGDSLDLLGPGPRDLPDRQRTLRNTMDWSIELLSEEERRAFALLAVFRGGFTVDAANAVCNPDGSVDIVAVLDALADNSLVQRVDGDEPRFAMLQVVREYAFDQLASSGQEAAARERHARFFSGLVGRATPELFGPGQRKWLLAIDREFQNIRAVLGYYLDGGRLHELAEMTWTLWPYWWFYGSAAEAGRLARAALKQRASLPAWDRARLDGLDGMVGVWFADAGRARPALGRAVEAFREVGDPDGTAKVLTLQALTEVLASSDPRAASKLIALSRPLFKAAGNRWGVAICANILAWIAHPVDAAGKPNPRMTEGLALARESGDDMNLGLALTNLAGQELALGHLDAARQLLSEGLRLLGGLRLYYAIAYCYELAAAVAAQAGLPGAGMQLMGAADGLRDYLSVAIYPTLAERRDEIAAQLSRALPPAEARRLRAKGRTLDCESALALAVDVCEQGSGAAPRHPRARAASRPACGPLRTARPSPPR